MTSPTLRLISPVDGSLLDERSAATAADLDRVMHQASAAQRDWATRPLGDRLTLIRRAVDRLVSEPDSPAAELAWQMGRPVRYGPGELARAAERADHMLRVAAEALDDMCLPPAGDCIRVIRREPIGVVLVIAPWNYPYLTAINSIVPALAAGNSVVLKHSPQVALVADRFARAFASAGLPEGSFQVLHADEAITQRAIVHPAVGHVVFTGSVRVGKIVAALAAAELKSTTLELGGKDAAYVRADADVAFAAEQLADGAFFNSGQSCCGIERIYAHADVIEAFVEALAAEGRRLAVSDPLQAECLLGPMATLRGADLVRRHVSEAAGRGARALLQGDALGDGGPGSSYVAPQILLDVDHDMALMREESFGPVVGVMPVRSDEDAVQLINNSPYGLSASIWSSDVDRCTRLAGQLDVGTVFANRCDYLDPALPWSGRKDSGLGLSLSSLAYATLTRPKSVLFRSQPAFSPAGQGVVLGRASER